jgi:hypothetical protein
MGWFILILILFILFIITFGLASFLLKKGSSNSTEWAERRCNIGTMFTAFKYKPADDPRSGARFMADNFRFCVDGIIDGVFTELMAPLMGILGANVGALGVFNDSLGNLRGFLGYIQRGFSDLMGIVFGRFKSTVYQFAGAWHRMNFLFQRAFAISTAFVYAGISHLTAFMNLYDFVVKVVIIIISIMAALIFLLFFILIPVMPVIFTMISVLVGAGLGSAVGGLGSVFCVDPEAAVCMADGSFKPLKECRLGDELASSLPGRRNIIEGILDCDGGMETCVSIDGVAMSGSHRVLWDGRYGLARDHPGAVPCGALSRLICLNTSAHSVPFRGSTGFVWTGDWEEVSDEDGRGAWLRCVYEELNRGMDDDCLFMRGPVAGPTACPLLAPSMPVKTERYGYVPLSSVRVGDMVAGTTGWTRVCAVYSGILEDVAVGVEKEHWISDGVWARRNPHDIWNTCITGSVGRRTHYKGGGRLLGLNIVTEAGTYVIRHEGYNVTVRDFTEIGIDKIEKTYDVVDAFM